MQEIADYKSQIEKNNVIAFVPGGNSMWPILKNRKQSVIVQKKQSRLKKFDVGFYQRDNGAFVLHRVMQVTPDGYIMCGDSQLTLERVKEENVFGVLTGFYDGDDYVEVTDEGYINKVNSFYKHKNLRRIRLKIFHLWQGGKNRLKKIFCKRSKKADKNG